MALVEILFVKYSKGASVFKTPTKIKLTQDKGEVYDNKKIYLSSSSYCCII